MMRSIGSGEQGSEVDTEGHKLCSCSFVQCRAKQLGIFYTDEELEVGILKASLIGFISSVITCLGRWL